MLVQQSCECDLEKVEWTQRALRFARFAKGDRALPALIAAQRFLVASAMAFRPAALRVRLRFAGAIVRGPGGRPRRFGPSRASMARFSLSRSANSNARICSLDIGQLIIAEISARRSSSSSNCTKTNEGAD